MIRNIKLVYSDIAPDAKSNFDYVLNNQHKYTKDDDLKLEEDSKNIVNLGTISELNQTFLDGNQTIVPLDLTDIFTGIWSGVLSDEDGKLNGDDGLILTVSTTTGNYTSQGFTLSFDEYNGIYPRNVSVKWYQGDTLLSSKDVTCSKYQCYIANYVANYNKVIFTFNNLNMPYNRLKISDVTFGTIRTYTNDELASMEIEQEISSISNEVSINTMDFKLISDDGISLLFQKKQVLSLYLDGELSGTYFVSEGERVASNKYEVTAEDYIGIMDSCNFYGGVYTSKSVSDLLSLIFTAAKVPYEYDSTNTTITELSGYIPVCSCREALQYVLFASGLVCDTSNSELVKVFSLDKTSKNTYKEDKLIEGQKTKTSQAVTEVQLTEHFYSQSSDTEAETLYDASEQGQCTNKLITFKSPYYYYTVNDGTIVESSDNYVVLTITSDTGTLTGKKYTETTSIYSIKNPNLNVSDVENIKSVESCTLIGTNNAAAICQKVYDYYIEQTTVTASIDGLAEKVGDTITVSNSWNDDKTGIIESLTFNAGNGYVPEVTIH